MSKITLKVDGQPYGEYKFKQPFVLQIPATNGYVTLDAKLGGLRSAHLSINVRPGTTERVLLEYNRAWGNIYFTHIPNPYNQSFNIMKQYFFCDASGQQRGPVSLETLKNCGITPSTLVWCEGMPQWEAAQNVPEVSVIFNAPGGRPTPPPTTQQSNQDNWNQPNPGNNQGNWGNNMNQNNNTGKPQNFLWLAICTTLLCCLPCGIVSIVYASKVDGAWTQGNYVGAKEYSDKAKLWGIISAGVGFLANIIVFIIALAA